jgi:hypothetical protein
MLKSHRIVIVCYKTNNVLQVRISRSRWHVMIDSYSTERSSFVHSGMCHSVKSRRTQENAKNFREKEKRKH